MSDWVIKTEGLGKKYRLGGSLPYLRLTETLTNVAAAPFRRLGSRSQDQAASSREHWALKDLNIQVQQGDIVGIIGRNGAGKSTLLKILSRITEPTCGSAQIRGRLGSLLEVGTGFHPEMTGRENIYLNGALLGMRHSEITRKFDSIVDFAEVEKFLDTPVKRYSSGMYVRLAFAVAAHLEPEILLIDEVLAVGDIAFQRKCIERMGAISREGRTVLVVSHSMSTIKALCNKAILLDRGTLVAQGPSEHIIAHYLRGHVADADEKTFTDEDHPLGVRSVRLKRIRLHDGVGGGFRVHWRQPITITAEIQVLAEITGVALGAGIRAADGQHLFTVHHDDDGRQPLHSFSPGTYAVRFTLQNPMRPGLYRLDIGGDLNHLSFANILHVNAATLEVLGFDQQGRTPLDSNTGIFNGVSNWEMPVALGAGDRLSPADSATPQSELPGMEGDNA